MAFRQRSGDATAAYRFVRASLHEGNQDSIGMSQDVCSNCHVTDQRGSLSLPLKGLQIEENFKRIDADTFKTIPGRSGASGHSSCFACHWEAQKPTHDDCNGCHLMKSDFVAQGLQFIQPAALSPKAVNWFKDWPNDVPKRFSLKFRHNTHTFSPDGKSETNNHDLGCTTCHANIAQMTTLNIAKADVQIASCAPCHSATSAIPVNETIRVTIFDEMTLKADSTKPYACVACHTNVVGREQPPCSHYAVLGEACPKAASSAKP